MMADFSITSLRGGLSEDPPDGIADDQVTVADNVEWVNSKLGERRRGCLGIDLTGSDIEDYSRVIWSHLHTPTEDLRDIQQWLFAARNDPAELKWLYKDRNGWTTVVPVDEFDVNSLPPFQIHAASFNGKLFIAYKSLVDRLHVWDGTSFRRTGLAEPAAPVVANEGSGTYVGVRYFRVRYIVVSGAQTLRRSEPSETTEFTPSGTGAGAQITKPAAINEGETHWEVEASLDGATFYRISSPPVGTGTYNDETSFTAGYAGAPGAVLSAAIGDYTLIPSVQKVVIDDDRLVCAGSFEDPALSSQVVWTVVKGDVTGVGNDERIPISTNNFKDLNTLEGGAITNMVGGIQGYVFVTKFSHTYRLNRTGTRANAYDAICLTKFRGAIEGSLVAALDIAGNPILFGLDPDVGPWRYGTEGLEQCGLDLQRVTWPSINLDANLIPFLSLFFPEHRQIHWWVATGVSERPNLRLVLHVDRQRKVADGWRGGWARWIGPSAEALSVNLFATNIDDMDAFTGASKALVPFIGVEGNGLFWQTTVGDDDNGTAYAARVVTKPYIHGDLLNQFECKSGVLLGKAEEQAAVAVTASVNFGLTEKAVAEIDLSPEASEEWVIRTLDDLGIAEARTLQIEFADVEAPDARWQIERFGLREVGGQRA